MDPCGPRATISGYPAGYGEGVVGGLRESDHVEFFKLELQITSKKGQMGIGGGDMMTLVP